MRRLTVILPGMLLLGLTLFLYPGWDQPTTSLLDPDAPAPAAGGGGLASAEAPGGAAHSVIWLSHDWIEPLPTTPDPDASQRRAAMFGFDRTRALGDCVDPNCRACLIDLVYGREF